MVPAQRTDRRLYLIMYMLMYASAIKLRRTQPDLPRAYKVPGGNAGMC